MVPIYRMVHSYRVMRSYCMSHAVIAWTVQLRTIELNIEWFVGVSHMLRRLRMLQQQIGKYGEVLICCNICEVRGDIKWLR